MRLFEPFRGVKNDGLEIGIDKGRDDGMIYSYRGMVWGVDLIHLVWVGVGIEKARGSRGLKICILRLFEPFRGVKDDGLEIGRDEGRDD